MIRVGLCCTFLEAPIRFRKTTAKYAGALGPETRREFLHELVMHNARALVDAIAWCAEHGVGAFRINSDLMPLMTHPVLGYSLDEEVCAGVPALLGAARELAHAADIRLSFHPDQFVVPGSLHPHVVEASLRELDMQARVAELVGAEQLTIHGGGAQGGKPAALDRLRVGLERLSAPARSRVVLENDDTTYTVEDLLPVCRELAVPLVYDVHHHRCNPDGLAVEAATELAAETWRGREPWAHLSTPLAGWREGGDPRAHADYIELADLPAAWLERTMTVDIEAKAKELAVVKLARQLVQLERQRGTVAA